jgi:hypothetical protein
MDCVKKSPLLLYIIAFVFLCLSVVHFLSLAMILRSWAWLRVFETNPCTGTLFFINLFFGLGFLLAGLFLLLRRPWAYGLGGILSVLSTARFWIGRTILNSSPLPFSRQVFILILSILLLAFILLSLWLIADHMKPELFASHLMENDHESEN